MSLSALLSHRQLECHLIWLFKANHCYYQRSICFTVRIMPENIMMIKANHRGNQPNIVSVKSEIFLTSWKFAKHFLRNFCWSTLLVSFHLNAKKIWILEWFIFLILRLEGAFYFIGSLAIFLTLQCLKYNFQKGLMRKI